MKYIYTLISMAIVSFAVISINPQTGHSNSTGAPAGKTGAQGESTCADAGCHGGTAANAPNAITTDVPATGYESGKTYNITVMVSEVGRPRFGFQARASAGTLSASTETQLVGGGSYITHRLASTNSITDSKSWTFTWTAPAVGTGAVTFNAAMLAANGNGSSTGDNVYRSSLQINESLTNGIKDFASAGMALYPVPFSKIITLEKGNQTFETALVKIYNFAGKLVAEQEMKNSSLQFNTEDFANGIYFVKLSTNTIELVQKVVKVQ